MFKRALFAAVLTLGVGLTACQSDADRASYNLSKAADNFEITRRIVFYNGITDTYILQIEGLCSLGNSDGPREVTVTCKVGPDEYLKHKLGISDNVTYFMEQMKTADVSVDRYRVIFKPLSVIPDIEIK